MSATQKFFRFLFGVTGTRTTMPDPSQGDGSVSYQDGYGLDYQRQKTDPLSKNIERDKMNQLFYDVTLSLQQYQLNGVPEFVAAADNGGVAVSYPKGARVLYTDGVVYLSLVAANVVLPDSDPTKWARLYGVPLTAAAAGTADALTAAPLPAVLVLTDKLPLFVRAASANATTTPNLTVSATAAKTIVKGNNLPLLAGDIAGAGHWLSLVYDLTLDKYVLQNPASGANLVPAFPSSQAASGWHKLPNGLIEQWGQVTTNASGLATITFPTPFPTICYAGSLTVASSGAYFGAEFDNALNASNVSAPVRLNAAAAQQVYYRFIGK